MLRTVEGAAIYATKAHDGQVDKSGVPYILHPLRVGAALHRFGVDAVIAGFLHDVVEDTVVTLDDLRANGASESVLSAVESVTKTADDGSYQDQLDRALADPIGAFVKAADVMDNLSRINGIPDELTQARLKRKYEEAVKYLIQWGAGVDLGS